jgi:hypothetical protein
MHSKHEHIENFIFSLWDQLEKGTYLFLRNYPILKLRNLRVIFIDEGFDYAIAVGIINHELINN